VTNAVELRKALEHNEILVEVLRCARALALPGWYLTAGCVVQTVWNVLTGRDPAGRIKDYDLVYFDDRDLGWAAEDRVIREVASATRGLPVEVEVRNEARVHLWYETKFGVRCEPFAATEDAIARFPAISSCFGVRLERGGHWQVYAPHGYADLFSLIVRPNPVLAPREVYERKAVRWKRNWPELTVLPWPD
jgi:hypothetical protein